MHPQEGDNELMGRRLSRRELLAASAAAAGAAAFGLSACSQEGEQATSTATPAVTSSTGVATATPPGGDVGAFITDIGLGGNPEGIIEVAPKTIFFPYFGNVVAFLTDEGILIVDTSMSNNGASVVEELRKRTDLPVHTIVYTHWHVDHVGGVDAFLKDAETRGYPRPRIIGHSLVADNFRRAERMAGYTRFINCIQWGFPYDPDKPTTAPVFAYPSETYEKDLTLEIGGERFELGHGIGETNDHTWVWAPDRGVICPGDFFIWACPNVGNPWKVQRFAEGWAEALEAMAELRPKLLLPGHGGVIEGEGAVQTAMLDTARFLRSIHDQVIDRMNHGQWLEQILREVEPPADLASKPYLQPIYGHSKFIVTGVYRQYGGWYDGDPANFFASSTASQSGEIVRLAGPVALLARARQLQSQGDLTLACHLVDWVLKAQPEDRDALALWQELFAARGANEVNMMARNTFRTTANDAQQRLGG